MVSASDIYKLLEYKYPIENFLTIPECKIGSTWFKPMCSRFDMWTMARSWKNPRFIGCEIKVSRQDFLGDNKWQNYLPYCAEFYFVASHGIVNSSEVPEQAGLIEATKNCKRLIIKKKAPVRDIKIPQSLLIYILMCRSRITTDNIGRTKTNLWKDRLKEIKSNKGLGHDMAFHIRSLVDKKVEDVLLENRRLMNENERLQIVKDYIESLGISEKDLRFGRYSIERKIKEVLSGIPFDLPQFLKQIEHNAGKALEVLNQKGG